MHMLVEHISFLTFFSCTSQAHGPWARRCAPLVYSPPWRLHILVSHVSFSVVVERRVA